MSDGREIVGRWESDSGKDWVELYRDAWGYGYSGRQCGGSLGKLDESDAIDYIEQRTRGGAGFFHSGKKSMRQMIPAGNTGVGARVADRDRPERKGTVAEEFSGYTVVVEWDDLDGQRMAHERIRLINFRD